MAPPKLRARPAVPKDAHEIREFVDTETQLRQFGRFDLAHLIENASTCLVAIDESSPASSSAKKPPIVGLLVVTKDVPVPYGVTARKGMERLKWAAAEAAKTGHRPDVAAWISGCATRPEHRDAVLVMLQTAFDRMPAVEAILAASPPEVERGALGGHVKKVAKTTRFALYAAPRATVRPRLRVRRARVEDHDDLHPLLSRVNDDPNAPGGALSRLPTGGDGLSALSNAANRAAGVDRFALARLIEEARDSPSKLCVLVAETEIVGKFAGVMALSALDKDVRAERMVEAYDLAAYDDLENFYPPPEECGEEVKRAVTKVAAVWRGKIERRRIERAAREKEFGAGGMPPGNGETPRASAKGQLSAGRVAEDDATAATAASSSDAPPAGEEAPEPSTPRSLSAREERIRREKLKDSSAFVVTMLCVDPEYEAQSADFLAHAFAAFPRKDVCAISLHTAAPELPLVDIATTRVSAKDQDQNHTLHLAHRAGQLPGFAVRLAAGDGGHLDAEAISEMLGDDADARANVRSFRACVDGYRNGTHAAVVATCEDQVVGFATFTLNVEVDPLISCFQLDDYVDVDAHRKDGYADLEECVLNPIFSHKRAFMMTEAMRLLKKTAIAYRLAMEPNQPPPPEVVGVDFQLVAGRRNHLGFDASFALFIFTARIAATHREQVNQRVVVVGSTESALGIVERLLTIPECVFNNVTLLAVGGLAVGGPASYYNKASLAKLALERADSNRSGISIHDHAVVGLDRDARELHLDDGTSLSYELLAIACGRQDQVRHALALDDDVPVERLYDLCANLTEEDARSVEKIIVYGDTLRAVSAVRTLLNKGVRPEAIQSVVPTPDYVPPSLSGHRRQALMPPSEGGRGLRRVALAAGAMLDRPHVNSVEGQPPAMEGLTLTGATKASGGGVDATFSRSSDSDDVTVHADFVVACADRDIDPVVFKLLNDNGIVYDGHVVVDASFRTNDPDVYATGSVAKFSRRCGAGALAPLGYRNARECGMRAADSIIRRVTDYGGVEPEPTDVPKFYEPNAISAVLPGGVQFLNVASAFRFASDGSLEEPPPGGRYLETANGETYTRIDVDAENVICGLLYCGEKRVDATHVSALIGLPVAYVQNLEENYAAGDVKDLLEYCLDVKLNAIFHAKFRDAHRAMMEVARAPDEDARSVILGPRTMDCIAEEAMFEFVKRYDHDLPHYKIPKAAVAW